MHVDRLLDEKDAAPFLEVEWLAGHCTAVAETLQQLVQWFVCLMRADGGYNLCQMFISLDHEKSNYGVGSPGPATAAPPSGIGRPQLSTNKSMPAWGFGTAKGSARNDITGPGPGEYFA